MLTLWLDTLWLDTVGLDAVGLLLAGLNFFGSISLLSRVRFAFMGVGYLRSLIWFRFRLTLGRYGEFCYEFGLLRIRL